DTTAGNESISIVHGDGPAVVITKDSLLLKNKAGDAYIELNAGGITLNGNIKVTGAEVHNKTAGLGAWTFEVNATLAIIAAGSGLPTNPTVPPPVVPVPVF